MEYEMRTEMWETHRIRFVEINDEWWAVLKDICDALTLRTDNIARSLDHTRLKKVRIEVCDHSIKGVTYDKTSRARKYQTMLVVNELGIYEALFASRRPEARRFRQWSFGVLKKLRKDIGLEGYEVMKMTEPTIQEEIDYLLDTLFIDEKTGKIMQSVTVEGGDVEQVPYEE